MADTDRALAGTSRAAATAADTVKVFPADGFDEVGTGALRFSGSSVQSLTFDQGTRVVHLVVEPLITIHLDFAAGEQVFT